MGRRTGPIISTDSATEDSARRVVTPQRDCEPLQMHTVQQSAPPRTTVPCAACKLLRRKCVQECPFAPYFPPAEPHKFACVHKVFGASNVSKMLMEVHESQRADVANSLIYEANARIRDPVYGCLGAISALQQEAQELQAELHALRTQIMRYRFQETAMAAAASANHHLNSNASNNSNGNGSLNSIRLVNAATSGTPPLQLPPRALTLPSNDATPSFSSSQTTANSGNTEPYVIESPDSTIASHDMKDDYWSQLHQSC
ncbi:hypothetical protein KP509_36G053800 [Ceratopteris richardii]|uniref:LOB domain-containing protein n=1 Tax=Ceratopteris richardii TaxID=49495 RepID=A0A8T2QD08_CERRI|nr:hypothetical protein KP509_36G053800 [Ceratopteris richardii]